MKDYKRLRVHENDRGWLLEIRGTIKDNGKFSYAPNEGLEMARKLVEAILDLKVEIKER